MVWSYLKNLTRVARGHRYLLPRVAIYYLTAQCNFNCAYCEDFGQRRNIQAEASLELEQARHVLRIIRQGVDSLILTGGEPLLYPDITALVAYARRELRFRQITLTTNGSLLPHAEALLPYLDRLVISLDAVDPEQWSAIIRMPVEAAQNVLDNIRRCAVRQKADRFRLILNAVLSPETLAGADALLDFCRQQRILVSFSPQAVCNWPRYELITSPAYRAFILKLVAIKRRGGPVLGSLAYLRGLLDLRPYACYPTLTPRILPNGDLSYPCRPIQKSDHSHGGRIGNLMAVKSWQQAQALAFREYGLPPRVCSSCFQQCYMEPSLMQAQPLSLLREKLFYPPSRQAGIDRYVPG
jgi:MoaA/NifB/PqqE/SkfB family radical SAM enzyme